MVLKMARWVISIAAFCAVTVTPTTASAAACGRAGATATGLAITNVQTADTTCRVGRYVARRYGATGATKVRDAQRRTWTCRVTQAATGTDPGYVARTKVRCTRGRAVVRLELRS